MPESLKRQWHNKQLTDTILVFMNYWKLSLNDAMTTPIPAYIEMMRYMEKDLKERKKQQKKQRSGMSMGKGR